MRGKFNNFCSILNNLTVEEFLEIYSKIIQERMSELGYYVQDGLICIDQKRRGDMRKITKVLLLILGYVLAVTFGFMLFIAFLTFFIGWAALGQ